MEKKFDILDDIFPSENVELEHKSNYECTESMVGLI